MKIYQDINTDHHDELDRELKVIYRDGNKVWPPEDPLDVYEAMAKRFDHIENELRSMRAELAEIIRDAVLQPNTYVHKHTAPTIYWGPNTYIPEACRSCMNHPSNGGTGVCHCTIGSPSVTCNSIDCPGR